MFLRQKCCIFLGIYYGALARARKIRYLYFRHCDGSNIVVVQGSVEAFPALPEPVLFLDTNIAESQGLIGFPSHSITFTGHGPVDRLALLMAHRLLIPTGQHA